MDDEILRLVSELGLSKLAAAAYLAVLSHPQATGYRIAKVVGKPVPNTYKALEALAQKGLVVVDESGGTRRFWALPLGEYMDRLESDLRTRRLRVEQALASLASVKLERGLYRIDTADALWDRAASLVNGAKTVAAIDVCPIPLVRIKDRLIAAAARGVVVLVKAYEEVDLPGCHLVVPGDLGSARGAWRIDWLHLVTDGTSQLSALLSHDRVRVAVWGHNLFLACIAYNGLFAEFLLTRVMRLLDGGGSAEAAVRLIEEHRAQRTGNLVSIESMLQEDQIPQGDER